MMDILSFLNSADKTSHSLTIPEYITLAKDIILAVSALAAAIIAWRGLATWKMELKGKSEYEKAKQVLTAVYKVRESFINLRDPCSNSFEYPEILCNSPRPLSSEQIYEIQLHIYTERRKGFDNAFQILEEQTINAQVEWGNEYHNIILPLRECRDKLYGIIASKLGHMQYPDKEISEEAKKDIQEVLRSVHNYNSQDNFTLQINTAIAEFEKKLRPHIGKKCRLCRLIH